MKKIFLFLLIGAALKSQSQSQINNLMPKPVSVSENGQRMNIVKDFSIAITGNPGDRVYKAASSALRRLDNRTGIFFKQGHITAADQNPSASLIINVGRPAKIQLGEDESYRLSISSSQVKLFAPTDIGAIYGLETLLQLLSADQNGYFFPGADIKDNPRFPWRGMLIDVCLHWMPMEVILRNIDLMTSVKMNVLHLHLSEDQMFGIESKVFPRLHQVGAEGNYFTQEEIKKIITYADQHGMRVVPEFDVPGHCTSMLRAYPELAAVKRDYELQRYFGVFDPALDVTKPYTYEFLDKLFGEMAALFPDDYFHIGGDENTGEDWKRSPSISQYMKDNKMTDYRQLQTEFMKKLLPIVQKHGKKMMGWDEILYPGVPKDIMIQSWRGHESLFEGARQGYTGLLSTGYYIDLIQPTDFHYLNDPVPANAKLTEAQKMLIVGGEATMWTEHVTPETVDSRIWPRTAAIAERLWSEQSVNDVDDMYRRLDMISLQLDGLGSTHLKNKEVLLRRLSAGYDTRVLQTLVDVIEPLKIYQRNAGDTMYTVFSPYTKIADVATPDQAVARLFRKDVLNWVKAPDVETEKRITENLMRWRDNHTEFLKLVQRSPQLSEALILSENLSAISEIGLEAIQKISGKKKSDAGWKRKSLETCEKAKQQGGRCDLQVVTAIEQLIART
jgi:hexosaminidase